MAGWQREYASDCKPELGRFESYPSLQVNAGKVFVVARRSSKPQERSSTLPTRSKLSGCSAVWLAHLLWEQRVVSSNPTTPTNSKKETQCKLEHVIF